MLVAERGKKNIHEVRITHSTREICSLRQELNLHQSLTINIRAAAVPCKPASNISNEMLKQESTVYRKPYKKVKFL